MGLKTELKRVWQGFKYFLLFTSIIAVVSLTIGGLVVENIIANTVSAFVIIAALCWFIGYRKEKDNW